MIRAGHYSRLNIDYHAFDRMPHEYFSAYVQMQINSAASGAAFINITLDLGAIISPRGLLVRAPVNYDGRIQLAFSG